MIWDWSWRTESVADGLVGGEDNAPPPSLILAKRDFKREEGREANDRLC
jgi:hypothetical protein